ncbi:MAG: tRNA adenosine(34) deaminase TadA [Thermodesulfobacteriota bacterium]
MRSGHNRGEDAQRFMALALNLAEKAFAAGETPVGAVVVRDGLVLGTGYNRVEQDKDPTAHAEIVALREATAKVRDWRLPGSTVYVTLEPCIMCSAALLAARVERVVFGAWDHRWGGLGSLFDLSRDPRINHELEVISGVMSEQAAALMKAFFENLRRGEG